MHSRWRRDRRNLSLRLSELKPRLPQPADAALLASAQGLPWWILPACPARCLPHLLLPSHEEGRLRALSRCMQSPSRPSSPSPGCLAVLLMPCRAWILLVFSNHSGSWFGLQPEKWADVASWPDHCQQCPVMETVHRPGWQAPWHGIKETEGSAGPSVFFRLYLYFKRNRQLWLSMGKRTQ